MSAVNYLLQELLNCGYLDLQFIDRIINHFEVDISECLERIREWTDKIVANDIIYQILNDAVLNVIEELEIQDFDYDRNVQIYTNCIDSHLEIKMLDGDWQEAYNKNDLIEILKQFLRCED